LYSNSTTYNLFDMKKSFFKPYLALLIAGILLVTSCTKDYEILNTNQNNVATIGAADLPFLLTHALSAAPNSQWNYQVAQNLFADQYAQYFACTATYFGSDRLVINQNWVGAAFNPMYTDVLPQLQTIMASTDSTSAEWAIASIWWVYTFHRVTDYWGPIPYFHAGQTTTSVSYDPQDKIYADFFRRLSYASTVLKGKTSETPYGSFDTVFGGDVSKWLKFCNSLWLRLAVRVSNVDPTNAKTQAEAAVAAGVMDTSPDDDALVQRSTKGSDGNGLAIMEWNEFRMSNTMESVLKGYSDPRISEYYLPSVTTGDYEGLPNGLTPAQQTDPSNLNTADYNSHHGPRWSPTDVAGGISTYLQTSQNVMSTAESYFNRAEGVLKGWNMGGGTAQSYYELGIKHSFLQWGLTADPAVYAASTAVPIAPNDFLSSPPVTDIPVAFGSTVAVQAEQIATQKWIAMFPEGQEAWADYRRNHKNKLYPVANSDNPLITNTATQWLRRIPFLLSEQQTNAAGVATGVTLLGSNPDNTQTPLWWDTNP
jgi:hypothetical protein